MSKSSKLRACPAVQRQISAAECGENRVSRYACPADCPFNPFAPARYDDFFAIEKSAIQRSCDWFLATAPDRAATERQIDQLAGGGLVERHGWQVSEFYYKRDANGRTCAERWAAAGFPGLKNDERVIQRAAAQLRPRLMEVHRVFDDLRIEVVDLLEPAPQPFLVCDRALAAQACRFTTLLGWFFPLPHYWRSYGFAVSLPAIGSFEPREAVGEIIRHLGGPLEYSGWNEWLGFNYVRFAHALDAVALARREQMFAGLDAEFGKAVYELRAPFADCRAALDELAAVAHDALADGERNEGFAEARVWFAETPGPALPRETARLVLGRVLLGQAHWRLEAMGAEKLARLREQFEAAFGERVRFTGERRDNLLAHLKSKEPRYDRALVPPRLLEQPSKIVLSSSRIPVGAVHESLADATAGMLAKFERAWLEEPVPALAGKTPREAVRDPALRPGLIRLLKERVRACDEKNLETGGSQDVNWLLKELGVDEIMFEPPPRRPPTGPETDDEFDGDAEAGAEDGLEHWPQLPSHPFTREETAQRLLAGLSHYPKAEDAIGAMEEAGGFLLEDVPDVIGDLLSDEEYTFLEPYLLQAWFAFVPPGCYGPDIEPEDIHNAFGRQLTLLESAAREGLEASGRFLVEQGPQPALIQMLAVQLLDQWNEFHARHKAPRENRSLMLVVLRAVVEALDAKCRVDEQ